MVECVTADFSVINAAAVAAGGDVRSGAAAAVDGRNDRRRCRHSSAHLPSQRRAGRPSDCTQAPSH